MGQSQVIYAVLALAIIGFLTLFLGRSQQTVYYQMYQNEMLTQVSGVATEILEDIGARPFDFKTEGGVGWDEANPPTIDDLTLTTAIEWGKGCDNPI